MMPVRMIVRPGRVDIPAGSPRRLPPRPESLQPVGYGDQFDSETLYFDVFREGSSVRAVGPPLLNLADQLDDWQFGTEAGPIVPPRIAHLDRSHRATFRIPARASTLKVADRTSSRSVPIGPDLSSPFAGTRALVTHQLDNDLEWIRDWVRWHVRAQGTDAVVIYDNGSSRYDLDELLDSVAVEGVRVAAVVEWPFRYGPQGSRTLPWDSDFTQYGALEHARRRILRRAAGMLSVDIDELVYSAGTRTAYDCATASPQGFALFDGVWTYSNPVDPPASPRHADCLWVRTKFDPAATKWCAVPSRLPARSQLIVHDAHGLTTPPTSPISYWHMRPISTNWKMDRSGAGAPAEALTRSPLIEAQVDRYLLSSTEVEPPRPRSRGVSSRVLAGGKLLKWNLRRLGKRVVRGS